MITLYKFLKNIISIVIIGLVVIIFGPLIRMLSDDKPVFVQEKQEGTVECKEVTIDKKLVKKIAFNKDPHDYGSFVCYPYELKVIMQDNHEFLLKAADGWTTWDMESNNTEMFLGNVFYDGKLVNRVSSPQQMKALLNFFNELIDDPNKTYEVVKYTGDIFN